jgi:pimeloyl-ACP methyl ester carboxylesterase
LAGVGAIRAASRYRHHMRGLSARLEAGSEVAHTACGPIEYASVGDGPPVLLVHGIGGGYDQGLRATKLAQENPFRLISVSRFGYLRTPLPHNASPEAQAGAHAALLDALGIERAAIVGISAGGPSSLLFALRYPERCAALVTVSAVSGRLVPQLTSGERTLLALLNRDLSLWLLNTLAESAVLSAYGITPKFRAGLADAPEKMEVIREIVFPEPMSKRRAGFDNDMALFPRLPRYPLEKIQAPTLALHGTADTVVPPSHGEFIANTVPGARLVRIEGGGHLCVVTHKEITLPLLMGFLAQHPA